MQKRTLLAVAAIPLVLAGAGRALAAPEPSPWLEMEESEDHDDKRFEYWHRQRAYPAGKLPERAFERAHDAWSLVPRLRFGGAPGVNPPPGPTGPGALQWKSIGPAGLTTTQSIYETPNMGPEAGRASAIAFDPVNPTTIYAGYSVGGVWRSKDDGATWTPLGDKLPSLAIGSIAVAPGSPDTVFVGTGEGALTAGYVGAGLFVTMDGGDSWTQLAQDVFSGLALPRLLIDPTTGDLYAAAVFGVAGRGEGCTNLEFDAPGQGVYRSTDLGATWTKLLAGKISDLEIDFAASPARMIAVDYETGATISTDGGASWAPVSGLPMEKGIEVAMSPVDPTLVFAGIGENGGNVYVSHDGGATFAQLPGSPAYCGSQCYYDNAVLTDPTDPNVLWLGGSLCGLWKTENALAAQPTWQNVSAKNQNCGMNAMNWYEGFVHPDVHGLAVAPGQPTHIYAATDGGIARTVDGGVTWERLNAGVSTIQYYSVCLDPDDPDIVYGGAQDNGSSGRVGGEWKGIISGDGGFCAVNIADPHNVIVTDTAGSVILTNDTFTKFEFPFATQSFCTAGKPGCGDRASFIAPFLADPVRADTFYIGTFRVYRSTDKGKTWSFISGDLTGGLESVKCVGDFGPVDDTLTAIALSPNTKGVIYTGSASGELNATFDDGNTWTQVSHGDLPGRWVSDIAVDAHDPKTVWVSFSGFDANTPGHPGHVFRSTNGGKSWHPVDIGVDVPVDSLVAHPTGSGVLYAGTDLGALVSIDGGDTWKVLGEGLPDVPVFSLKFHRRAPRLVAGTHGRSAWSLDFGPGNLRASPGSLSFTGKQDEPNPPDGQILARDTEVYGSTARFIVETNQPWLFAGPGLGAAAGPQPTVVSVRVDLTKAPVGKQHGKVFLVPIEGTLGDTIEIPVELDLKGRDVPPPGPSNPGADTGCSCSAIGGAGELGAGAFAGLALLGALARRRRRLS